MRKCIICFRANENCFSVNVVLDWWSGSFDGVADELSALADAACGHGQNLKTIANRRVKIYPGGFPNTFTVDHCRRRFVAVADERQTVHKNQLISLWKRLGEAGLEVIKTENLYNFDGGKGYSA